MQQLSGYTVALLLFVHVALSGGMQTGGGVQKVIQMLTDMASNAKKEKQEEQIAFAKFETWCKMESGELEKAIKQEASDIELLTGSVGELTSQAEVLKEEIAKLQASVVTFEADIKAANSQREAAKAEYLTEVKDYAESVDALERAISVLESTSGDKPATAAVLSQLSEGSRLPAKAQSIVTALLGMTDGQAEVSADAEDPEEAAADEAFMGYKAPEANAYESQHGGIIEMLKKLLDGFRAKKGECQKTEMMAAHAHEMLVSELTNSFENANKDIEAKTALRQGKLAKAGEDKKQLSATTALKEEDEKTFADMKAECSQKKLSYEEKQSLRAEEIECLEKAIDIISGEEVAGNAEKHLGLTQAAVSLAQLRAAAGAAEGEPLRRRVRIFVATEGQRLHSSRLSMLAEKMLADPFAKVKKLIDDMITRLLEEANEDASHEGFCDKEMGESKITRNKLAEDIDALDAAVDSGKGSIMALAEEIKRLTQEVADLDASVAEATQLRQEDSKKNAATAKDAEAAKDAVEAALAVLKTFYEKAGGATALIQTRSDKGIIKMGSEKWKSLANPAYETGVVSGREADAKSVDDGHTEDMQTFGETYQGQQDEAGGVVALLEVIGADFARLLADTKAAEATSAKAFEDFLVESKKDKAMKTKAIEMDTADKAAAEAKLREDIADLKATQDELLAAERYYKKLVPQCVDQGMTWEERVKAREDEIASLKKALELLSSEDIETSA